MKMLMGSTLGKVFQLEGWRFLRELQGLVWGMASPLAVQEHSIIIIKGINGPLFATLPWNLQIVSASAI